MSLQHLKPFAALALVLAVTVGATSAQAAPRAAASEQQELVNESRVTFGHFRDDPSLTWFREHEKDALGFLIISKAVRVGFVFGGSGGRGVLVAKGEAGDWNGPAFYTAGTASVGFQAGVDVSEIVVLVMTKKGLDSLLSASVKAGVDASVAAGPVGVGTGIAPKPDADFVYYSRSKGLYGGVSLEGAVIKPTDDWNKAYYGQIVSPIDILVRGSFRNPGAKRLLETVENAARRP
jgi:lipid-binding SYLF domain-containing protein